MTRTAVAVNAITRSNFPPHDVALTATTIDGTLVTNGVKVTDFFLYTDQTVEVYNSAGSPMDITFQAGTDRKCLAAGIGDAVVTVTNGTTKAIQNIESSRFFQSGDDLWIDFETGCTGTITVIGTPRGLG